MSKKYFFVAVLAMFLGACAPKSQMTLGTPIDQAKVNSIVKGQTTAQETVAMFGQPMNKALVGDQEQWMYMYQDVNTKTKMTAGTVQASGQYQKLDVMIKDGIVVNYLFNDAPFPAMHGSGSLF